MKANAASDTQAVRDMMRAGEAILRYAKGGKAAFLKDDMVQSAVERQFERMGEAARRLSEEFRQGNPEVPWRTIIAFRNYLLRGYDSIVPEKVWVAVSESLKATLPELRRLAGDWPDRDTPTG